MISSALTMTDVNVPYYTVKRLVTMLLEMEDCASHVEREHALLEHIQNEALREDLCLLNDLLVLKVWMLPNYLCNETVEMFSDKWCGNGGVVKGFCSYETMVGALSTKRGALLLIVLNCICYFFFSYQRTPGFWIWRLSSVYKSFIASSARLFTRWD